MDTLDRLDEIETALLDAVAHEGGEEIAALAGERDRLIRALAPTLDGPGLRALAARDGEFGSKMAAIRDRVLAELDGLRTGRRAARAYAETARA
jgi:hypothetical protein